MAGRKTKFTKVIREKILESLALGATIQMACDAAGISRTTFYDFLKKAESQGGQYRTFSNNVNKASAEGALQLLGVVQAASERDWKAGAWILERRYGYHRDGIDNSRKKQEIILPENPIDVLKMQAKELKGAMGNAEASQSWQAYAALQRQFLAVITQIRQIEAEEGSGDEMDGLTDEQLLHEITSAIISLPPILRQRLESSVRDLGNVVKIGE